MVKNPLAAVAILDSIIKSAGVLFESKASVEGRWQMVSQVAMSRHIQDAQIGFILTSLAYTICDQLAIIRNIKLGDACGVLLTAHLSVQNTLTATFIA